MKKVILTICITLLTIVTLKAQTAAAQDSIVISATDSVSFIVSGNCGMCQRTIEKAAMILGVSSAEWDMDSGKMNIVYDSLKTDILKIHQAIAASGYDTDKVEANTSTYNGLPGCCQYERISKEKKVNNE